MLTTSVLTAETTDQADIIATIVLSFSSDPPARWLFREPNQYLSNFPHFVLALGGNALANESAYYLDNFAGAALWLPPGVQSDEHAVAELLERTVTPEQLPHVFAIMDQLADAHPKEPHWYLPMIGVDPAKQGQGLGSRLLRHTLQRVDEEHVPAYLESTNPANIPLYEKHGFKLLRTIKVADAPPLFPMIRERR